jgi:hypothetical protein
MIQHPTWLGNFYGGRFGFLNYEVLTIQNIPHKELKPEAGLMLSKWFDYRKLHPMQATYYFVKCYTDAYRNFCRKAVNFETADYISSIKGKDFLKAREMLSFWRLRQLVDQTGMRYDFFLSFAMSWFYRMVSVDGKVYPPRPAHLLRNEDLIAEVMIAWEEQCSVSLQVARDPYYRVVNFTGSKNQLAHEAFVIGQAKARRFPEYSLRSLIYEFDAIRIEEALRRFDQRVVLSAIPPVEVLQE